MKKKIPAPVLILLIAAAVILVATVILLIVGKSGGAPQNAAAKKPKIDERIIKMSDYTYDGEALGEVRNIVIHYVANPGSTAR